MDNFEMNDSGEVYRLQRKVEELEKRLKDFEDKFTAAGKSLHYIGLTEADWGVREISYFPMIRIPLDGRPSR